MDNNVIDIKSKNPIFGDDLKSKLEAAVDAKRGVDASNAEIVESIEQVICTAMVTAARNLAESLATKFYRFIVKQ